MTILLRDSNSVQYEVLHRETGLREPFSLPPGIEQSKLKIDGHFATVNGHTLSLFRAEGVLYFRADKIEVPLDKDATVKWSHHSKGENEIQILYNGVMKFELIYPRPLFLPISLNPIGFGEEEEDFDFPLFVANVFNDVGRRTRIYGESQ